MKQILSVLFIGIFFFGCKDNNIDSSIISSGSSMSEHALLASQNLDKESYKDILDIVGDNANISFNKDVLIIFGKNNCTYCDMLKDAIKTDAKLQSLLKDNFNPYYINTSYDKVHNIIFKDKNISINTGEFASIFSINLTPTMVFFSKDGKVKYMFAGFSPKINDMIENIIAKSEAMGNYSDIDKKLQNLLGT